MKLEIQVLVRNRHTNVAELKLLMRSQPSPLDNWISKSNYITNDEKNLTYSTKQNTYYHKNVLTTYTWIVQYSRVNECYNMDCTI
jgi:hypothetical protein